MVYDFSKLCKVQEKLIEFIRLVINIFSKMEQKYFSNTFKIYIYKGP